VSFPQPLCDLIDEFVALRCVRGSTRRVVADPSHSRRRFVSSNLRRLTETSSAVSLSGRSGHPQKELFECQFCVVSAIGVATLGQQDVLWIQTTMVEGDHMQIKSSKRPRVLISALLVMVLVIAACAGADDDSVEPTADSETTEESDD